MTGDPQRELREAIERAARVRNLRRERAVRISRPGDDFLMAHAADDLMDRLSMVKRRFDRGAALFAGTGRLAQAMEASPQVGAIVRRELPDASPDEPSLEPGSLDLAVAPLWLHFAADLPGALIQIRRALRPDGLLLASLPGPNTLHEMRDALLRAEADVSGGASPRVDAFTEVRDAGSLLQRAGLALPVTDVDRLTVRYDDLPALVRDLRRMGVTQASARKGPFTRALLARASEIYAQDHADDDGRIRATFEIVSMSGWAPHETQQKPLRPGSAKSRLADALSTRERPLEP